MDKGENMELSSKKLVFRATVLVIATTVSCLAVDGAGFAAELEEIIVTAQQREQRLQDVPISVAAVTGAEIREHGYSRLDDLSQTTPNLWISDTTNQPLLIMRGVGTEIGQYTFEQSVATFNDGIYTGRSRNAVLGFLDLERVEVLRGPQATYYGMNATAGTLSITTKKPNLERMEGSLNVSYGSDEETTLEAAIGGPITDTFGARVAGIYDSVNGWLDNDTWDISDTSPDRESYGARLTLLWKPTDRFSGTFKAEYSETDQTGFEVQPVGCDPNDPPIPNYPYIFSDGFGGFARNACMTASLDPRIDTEFALDNIVEHGGLLAIPGAFAGAAGDEPDVPAGAILMPAFPGIVVSTYDLTDYPAMNRSSRGTDSNTAVLTLNYDWNDYTLTSITGYTDYSNLIEKDLDNTPYAIYAAHQTRDYEQVSQELRIQSSTGNAIEWLAGIYWRDADLLAIGQSWSAVIPFSPSCEANNSDFNCNVAVNITDADFYSEEAEWSSAYVALAWNVTERFAFDLGFRYEDVTKSAVFQKYKLPEGVAYDPQNQQNFEDLVFLNECNFGTSCPIGPFQNDYVTNSIDDDNLSFTTGVRWTPSEDGMFYLKYVEGYKAGGFSAGVGGSITLNPDEFVYQPEDAEGVEIGSKLTLLDGRMYLNTALFSTDYKNLQVSAFDPTSGNYLTTNAAALNSQGVETDGSIVVTDNFTVGFSAALLQSDFESYPGAACNNFEKTAGVAGCSLVAADDTGIDRAGRETQFAPDWTWQIDALYEYPLTNGMLLSWYANLYVSDGYTNSPTYISDHINSQESYELLDLRISLLSQDQKWEVAAYGRNVTDNQQITEHQDGFVNQGSFFIARTRGARYGVQATYSFD